MAFIIYAGVEGHTQVMIPHDVAGLTVVMIKEFAIGYIIGFCANLVFLAA